MKARIIIIAFLFNISYQSLIAQVTIPEDQNPIFKKGVVYDNEFGIDIAAQTNGFFLGFSKGIIKKFYRTNYYRVEIGTLRHPKESINGISGIGLITGRSNYTFGKKNSIVLTRLGWGFKRFISDKAEKKGVAVGYNLSGGPSLALQKPYYLNVTVSNVFANTNELLVSGEQEIIYETSPPVFLDVNSILGKGPSFKGYSDAKIRPGLNAKASIHLDWGAFDAFIKSLDVGIMIDAFFTPLEILVPEANDDRFLYLNFFAKIQLGKRS